MAAAPLGRFVRGKVGSSTLLPSVKGGSQQGRELCPGTGPPLLPLALLPYWWVRSRTVPLTATPAPTGAHPTPTAPRFTGPLLPHSSPAHHPVGSQSCLKNSRCFGRGLKEWTSPAKFQRSHDSALLESMARPLLPNDN